MRKSDLWSGAILIGLGLFITRLALRLDYTDEYGPGPGFFPFWIGIGLIVLAGMWFATTVFGRRPSSTEESAGWTGTTRALGIWAAFMVAVAVLNTLGFFVTFVLLAVFVVFVVHRRPLWVAATVGLGGAAGFYLLFVLALGVPMPVGPWGF